jgi:hypothetical protein
MTMNPPGKTKPAKDDASPHTAVAAQPQSDAPEAASPFESLQLGRVVWFREAGFDLPAIVNFVHRDAETGMPTGAIGCMTLGYNDAPRQRSDVPYDQCAGYDSWRWPTVPTRA